MNGPIALVANRDAGGALDVGDLVRALGGTRAVTVVELDQITRLRSLDPVRLVVAGGDGTIGAVAAEAARLDVPLGVVPAGTANDFARTLGLPLDVEAGLELAGGGARTRRIDLGWIGDRPFVNAASVGLAPEAARRAVDLKRRLGRFAYVAGAVRAATAARAVPLGVACDGNGLYTGRAWQAIVSNTGAFGGGSEVADADPGDGLLDVTVIPAGKRARLALDGVALRGGWIARRAGVHRCRAAVVRVEVPEGTTWNVDGELIESGPTKLRVERAAVAVVVG